jgi:hypothetical protein
MVRRTCIHHYDAGSEGQQHKLEGCGVPGTALAEMIGTTRSRVSFFTNRFRKLGFIHYIGFASPQLAAQCSSARLILHCHSVSGRVPPICVSESPKIRYKS